MRLSPKVYLSLALRSLRKLLGAAPMMRLKARLNEASDS
jgi:hypothetical protein